MQIPESLVILEFLADLFPDAHLLPADPVARTRARLFAYTVDTKLIPAFMGAAFMGAPMDGLISVLEAFQAMLPKEGGYAVGERWSIADAAFTPLLVRIDGVLEQNPPTMAPGVAAQALEVLRSERFARLQQYKRDNVARPSMGKTYDEVRGCVLLLVVSVLTCL